VDKPRLFLVKNEGFSLAREDAKRLSRFLHDLYGSIRCAKEMNLLIQSESSGKWHPDWFRVIAQDVGEDLEYLESSVASAMDYVDGLA
jgi:hypothetical protein